MRVASAFKKMIDTLWFRQRLKDVGISGRELGRKMGLDPAAVSLMLRGMRRM
jgi:transcriptional regulator with XRE-family HTH domain